jgi:uncharacterized membrane protein
VSGGILWANLHLLFWLSLVPFTTAWMGDHHDATAPTAVYGGVLLISGFAYWLLERAIIAVDGAESKLGAAIGGKTKEAASTVLYASSIPLAFVHPLISDAIFVVVAAIWFIPDRRIEARLGAD